MDKETLEAITSLEKIREAWLKKYIQVDSMIETLGGVGKPLLPLRAENNITINDPDYIKPLSLPVKQKSFKDLSVVAKVRYILRKSEKFLKRATIEDIAAQKEAPFSGSIVSTMSIAKKDGKLSMVEHNGNSYWGLPEWVDDDNNVIEEHYFKLANAE